MLEKLKDYCQEIVPLTTSELNLIDKYFDVEKFKKKELILESGSICNFIGFIETGTVRHFHVKSGDEKTCDISFETAWVTDFQSFTQETTCVMNLQAMEDTRIFSIKKKLTKAIFRMQ